MKQLSEVKLDLINIDPTASISFIDNMNIAH